MYLLPLLDGMINFPVGSDAILPVTCSHDANMWCVRMVGSDMTVGVEVVGSSRVSGWTKVSSKAESVVLNFVERWFFLV